MDKIFQRLQKNQRQAQAPYSHYKVGALVSTEKGDFDGFNVECSVYPLSLCAERVALFNALVHGAKKVKSLSLVTDSKDGGGTPCGSCRQVMAEHMAPNAKVKVYEADGSSVTYTVSQLLPHGFSAKQLDGGGKKDAS